MGYSPACSRGHMTPMLAQSGWTLLGFSVIEWIAVGFGIACVVLTVRQNIWCWPVGLVQVGLYIFIFYDARLYSDAGLHVVYVILCLYGWWFWLRGGRDEGPPRVTRLRLTHLVAWLVACAVGTAGLGGVMHRFTDADLPFWDAATTVGSLVAQYLMARKALESWLFWIGVDVVAIGVYAVKGLHPTAGLYVVFLVLATIGYFAWRSTWQANPRPA